MSEEKHVQENNVTEAETSEKSETKCENCKALNQKLKDLQENTIVQSMNEMKERYEDLIDTSVCRCVVDFAEQSYNELMDTLITVHTSLGLVREKVNNMKYLNICPSASGSVKPGLENVDFVLKHIQEVIKRVDNVRERLPFPQDRCINDCLDHADDDSDDDDL